MEIEIWQLPESAYWAVGGLNKETMTITSIFVWEKDAPLALNLKADNSVSEYMSLAFSELVPQIWS